jgi:hypothetical protein
VPPASEPLMSPALDALDAPVSGGPNSRRDWAYHPCID